jgi:AmmeMemoRadiSam system protein A
MAIGPEGLDRDPGALAIALAREAVERYVRTGRRLDPPPDVPPWLSEPGAVFVTLRLEGRLRGCMGRFVPASPRRVDELLAVAVLAATRDPRYRPVRAQELSALRYEVSLLGELEPVASLAELDPHVYGLVVQGERRRGGLLPRIPGVETAAQQVVIARIKARLRPDDPARLFRFRAWSHPPTGSDQGDRREPGDVQGGTAPRAVPPPGGSI